MEDNTMKHMNRLLSLLMCGALILTFAGCRAGSPANEGAGGTDQTTENETEETTLPQEQTMAGTEPKDTTAPEKTPEDTTAPTDPIEDAFSTEYQVVRTQDISQDMVESIINQYQPLSNGDLPTVHLTTLNAMDAFVDHVGSQTLTKACEMYGEDFFKDYDLVMIPSVTNTGSVTYTVEVMADGGQVMIVVSAQSPEIVTMDMANWFLVIPVPKDGTTENTIYAQRGGNMGVTPIKPIG